MPIERNTEYDPFAWVYNGYWGHDYHRQAGRILDRTLVPYVAPHAAVLDLCCGAGQVTRQIAERGYDVVGLDGSAEMLAFARQKLPEVEFVLADAREFRLQRRFAAVVSTFDSLNHVLSADELGSVFRCVYEALLPGGLFIFDLNRQEAYQEHWVRTGANVQPDMVCVSCGQYDPALRLATCDVTLFRQLEGWQRSDFVLRQRCHSDDEVFAALHDAGFAPTAQDARDVGMQGTLAYGRTFYSGHKD